MKEFKGTPGPWFWERGVLCNKDYIVGGSNHEFKASNKQLIAAAPELLEALQLSVSVIKNMAEPSQSKTFSIELATAAIAKALGETK